MPSSPKSLRKLAKAWAKAGLSVVPIRNDGSKAPTYNWQELQDRILTSKEIDEEFKPGLGIAIIAGGISGNLEFLDFDIPKDEDGKAIGECVFDAFVDCLDAELFALVGSMPMVRTPSGGVHLYYRCETIEGNRKLAAQQNPPGTKPPFSTLVETRGEGGYVLAPGCPPECHKSGRLYELVSGDFEDVPTISSDQRAAIFAVARSFDETDLVERVRQAANRDSSFKHSRDGMRPGDDFNRRGSWPEILEPHGWTFAYYRRSDGAQCWRRPGKAINEKGISATVRDFDGLELFHSFSSNCDPLPHNESITKFAAYALLEHDGDYEGAARSLGKQGFGEPPRRLLDLESIVDGRRDEDIPWANATGSERATRVLDLSGEEVGDEQPGSIPDFVDSEAPFDASIFHEEMDPLEVHLHEDEARLEKEEAVRVQEEKDERRRLLLAKGPAYIVWRDHGDPPKRSLTADGQIKTKVDKPRDTSWFIINDKFSSGDNVRTLHFQHKEFMLWNGERYRRLGEEAVRPITSSYLTHFAEYKAQDEETNKPIYEPFKVRKVRVDEMMATIKDMSHLDSDIQDPCWLCEEEGGELPDPREIVVCSNGLLDISKRKLLEPTAAYYSFTSTGIEYNPDAPIPELWETFLATSLPEQDSRDLLQQWFGYCLVQDTRLHKMLMVVGKPGSGKGVAMDVLQSLVGHGSCCSMDFKRIDNNFALSTALGKSLMIFPDARQGYRSDSKGGIVETLLSITGEDPLMVDRKNMKPIDNVKLNTRIVVVSNDVISLSDSSGALDRRMLWLKFPGFTCSMDPNLKRKLKRELPGILNWAIEGWHKVRSTGRFTQPESAADIIEMFKEQASPIRKFIDDMCVVGKGHDVKVGELFNYWGIWRKASGYKNTQSSAAFGKQLLSAEMSIKRTRARRGEESTRVYVYDGISVNMDKVKEFISDSVGEQKWNEAREEYARQSNADIVDIFEWAAKREKDQK